MADERIDVRFHYQRSALDFGTLRMPPLRTISDTERLFDPLANARAALRYMRERYGPGWATWSDAWLEFKAGQRARDIYGPIADCEGMGV